MAAEITLLARKYGIEDLSNVFEVERGLSVVGRLLSDGFMEGDLEEVKLLEMGLKEVRLNLMASSTSFSGSKSRLESFAQMLENTTMNLDDAEVMLSAEFFRRQRELQDFIKQSQADGTLHVESANVSDDDSVKEAAASGISSSSVADAPAAATPVTHREVYYTGKAASTVAQMFRGLVAEMRNSGIDLPFLHCSANYGEDVRVGTFQEQPFQPEQASHSAVSLPVLDGLDGEIDPINFNQESLNRYLDSLKAAKTTASSRRSSAKDFNKFVTLHFGDTRDFEFEKNVRKTVKQKVQRDDFPPSKRGIFNAISLQKYGVREGGYESGGNEL